jgi:KipI family sensor histidine kinase inhibitor
MQRPTVVPFGDGALLVVIGDAIDPELSRRAHRLAGVLREEMPADSGWGNPVPGYGSLLVPYDPLALSQVDATDRLDRMLQIHLPDSSHSAPVARNKPFDIPVRYGGADGTDLDNVAKALGLAPRRVIDMHAAQEYEVLLLGFAPGFAYMGLLPPELELPRRATPRTRVPPGSVAIAGRQTADELMTLTTAARLSGRAAVTLRAAAKKGRLEARKIGKTWVTDPLALAEYVGSVAEYRRNKWRAPKRKKARPVESA